MAEKMMIANCHLLTTTRRTDEGRGKKSNPDYLPPDFNLPKKLGNHPHILNI
jgi:hypothetical protein